MPARVAFAGFRHAHLLEVYRTTRALPELQIVAASEEDAQVRAHVQREAGVTVTHHSHEELLKTVEFDVLVVGEVFARRGALTLRALKAGKHVLSDKPICTTLTELRQIAAAAASIDRAVAGVLELRYAGVFLRLRELVRTGALGAIHAAAFSGQHPLLLGSRPSWYFLPGAHGGTLNDLAIHALDLLPWLTGQGFRRICAARCWNAGLPQHPEFRNCGQLMLEMHGGTGVIGDVSYLSPDGFGYRLPLYWRFTLWGEEGAVEGGLNSPALAVYPRAGSQPEMVMPLPTVPGGYWRSLLESLDDAGLRRKSNAELFEATRIALLAQGAADQGLSVFPFDCANDPGKQGERP